MERKYFQNTTNYIAFCPSQMISDYQWDSNLLLFRQSAASRHRVPRKKNSIKCELNLNEKVQEKEKENFSKVGSNFLTRGGGK